MNKGLIVPKSHTDNDLIKKTKGSIKKKLIKKDITLESLIGTLVSKGVLNEKDFKEN